MNYRMEQSAAGIMLEPPVAPDSAVIWLHGLGADGSDFVPLVPELRLPAGLAPRFVFPHAPVQPVTLNNGLPMRAWYDIYSLTDRSRQDDAGIRRSALAVEELIRQQRDLGIPDRRIVLAGFSQGGAIVLHTGLRHAQRLAGILALSTYLPLAATLAAEAAPLNRDLPILMCHGTQDPVITLEFALQSRSALLAAGYPLVWKEYAMQHQVCEEQVGDIAAWLAGVLAG